MADPATPGGGGPAPNSVSPPAPPAEFKVPDGKVLLDAKEHEDLTRTRQKVAGFQSFHERAGKFGFKRAEDFDRLGKLQERGLTLDQLLAAIQEDQSQPQGGKPEGVDVAALEKHFGSKFIPADQFESKLAEREKLIEARFEHKQSLARESEMVKKAIADLAGKDASPRDKWLIEQSVMGLVGDYNRRQQYPEGHPLRGSEFAPYTEETFGKLLADVKKNINLTEAAELEALGKAAAKPGPSSAGASVPQGKPKSETQNQSPRERIRATIERSGAPGGR